MIILKILGTILMLLAAVPVVGSTLGLLIGWKAEGAVVPTIFVLWGVIIYYMWLA